MQAERNLTAWLWATPNSNRVSILFEELGLDYAVRGVNIRRGEQKAAEVVSRNPYGKIPIVDWDDAAGHHSLFESGAILIDFAGRHGRFLAGDDGGEPAALMPWLMVVLTGLGPMMGQAHHWTALAPERPPAARAHGIATVRRIYDTLERRLADRAYLAGAYSIADIAAFPWIARSDWAELTLSDFPNLERWHDRIAARPAVRAGMAKPDGARLEG